MKCIIDITLINIINNFSDEGDIRDIKGLLVYELNLRYIFILTALVLITCLLILLRKKRSNIKKEEKLVLSPESAAMDRIRKLKGSNLITQGRIKEYYTILSDIVREYLEGKYKISAKDLTTCELICEIKKNNIIIGKIAAIQGFLSNCDLVKFAKHIPLKEDADKIMDIAVEIINFAKNNEEQAEIKSNV